MPKLSDKKTRHYKETLEVYTYSSTKEWADHIAEMLDRGFEFVTSDQREKYGYNCIFRKIEQIKETKHVI